ncbi:MAG: glycosyltransferase [Rikenellaceae bacterium]
MESKTILFVNGPIFHPERGGIERVTDILARAFVSRGYKILYLYQTDSEDGVLGYKYPAELFKLPSTNYNDTINIDFCERLIADKNIDIIINQAAHNPDISRMFSNINRGIAKLLSVIHFNPKMSLDRLFRVAMSQPNRSALDIVKKLFKIATFPIYKSLRWKRLTTGYSYLSQCSDKVVLLSAEYISELKQVMPNIEDNKIGYIPNPNMYRTQNVDTYNRQKYLLFVGRLDNGQKRPDLLLKIWKRLAGEFLDWELVFVGDGPMRSILEQQSISIPRVQFKGWQSPDLYYRNASIFCMTSMFEGLAMTLIEAMTYGVPVVAFQSFASITDIVEDGKNGYLIKPFNIDDYCEKLRLLMRQEQRRQELSKYAQESVTKFDIEIIVERWEQMFSDVTK